MSTMKRTAILVSALGLACLLSACAPGPPTLERFDDAQSGWIGMGSLVLESMSVVRGGDEVRANALFRRGEDRITLSIELFLEPPARFVAGSHTSRIAGSAFKGPLAADSVEFLGGQNDGLSVGGAFLFDNPSDGQRYRLRFSPAASPR